MMSQVTPSDDRSTRKPVSFEDESSHESLMAVSEKVVATTPAGAFETGAALGVRSVCTSAVAASSAMLNATTRYRYPTGFDVRSARSTNSLVPAPTVPSTYQEEAPNSRLRSMR